MSMYDIACTYIIMPNLKLFAHNFNYKAAESITKLHAAAVDGHLKFQQHNNNNIILSS